MKKFLIIAAALLLLLSFVGCARQDMTVEGFSANLEGFSRKRMEGFEACFEKGNEYAIFVTKERFAAYEEKGIEKMTDAAYADYVKSVNKIGGEVVLAGGVPTFEYEAEGSRNVTYHYLAYCFVGKDAYWMVQFAAKAKDFEGYRAEIEKIGASIVIE